MIKKLQALKAKKGFTLVELIVVIAIIGVLAAILVPTLMGQVTKSKQSSLDSTAQSVVTTVNTWIADRYTHGKTASIDGVYTSTGGGVPTRGGDASAAAPIIVGVVVSAGGDSETGGDSKPDTSTWSVTGASSDNTSLSYALTEAISFGKADSIKFWIVNGKCAAAAFVQGGTIDKDVNYSLKDKAWTAAVITNEKDGIVNQKADGSGDMIGTNPKTETLSTKLSK